MLASLPNSLTCLFHVSQLPGSGPLAPLSQPRLVLLPLCLHDQIAPCCVASVHPAGPCSPGYNQVLTACPLPPVCSFTHLLAMRTATCFWRPRPCLKWASFYPPTRHFIWPCCNWYSSYGMSKAPELLGQGKGRQPERRPSPAWNDPAHRQGWRHRTIPPSVPGTE